jgi:transposase
MAADPEALPDDVDALKAALRAARVTCTDATARALRVEAELAIARARASDDQALIAHQQVQIAKLRHQLYGQPLGTFGAVARPDGAGGA